MKTSNETILGKIIGFAGYLLMLPFLIVLWLGYTLARGVRDFLDFSGEFFKSPDDFGLGGFWAMQAYWREAARAEALQKQYAAQQEEAARLQQYRRRVQEAQQREDLRRQKLAEEQAAQEKANARNEDAAQHVPEQEDEEVTARPLDGAEKEKLFWEAVKRQEIYNRMYIDYKKKKAGESE
ncbi:MAG: hypothetical protein J5858_03645 [Lentisphaeria bacterium]|nr:hypothetical protein [Lentisphaeria bacterium]